MSEGWLVSPELAADPQFAQLSREAKLVYLMTIPHLSGRGRIEGDPAYLARKCCPGEFTAEEVAGAIEEWLCTDPKPLVEQWVNGKIVLRFRGFERRQHRLLRLRLWRAECALPDPPDELAASRASGAHVTRAREAPASMQGVVQASPSPGAAAGEGGLGGEGCLRLRQLFHQLFQRQPARLSEDQTRTLEALVAELGVESAAAIMRERAGADPRSLAWFLPVFEERAAERRAYDAAEQNERYARFERHVRADGHRRADEDLEEDFRAAGLAEAEVASLLELAERLRLEESGQLCLDEVIPPESEAA